MVYQLYDSAFRILDIRNNLLENFTGSRKQIIDLAASTIPSSYLLPELLAGFGRMYPDVYFHSWQTDSSGAINRVLDGTVDLALTGQNLYFKIAWLHSIFRIYFAVFFCRKLQLHTILLF